MRFILASKSPRRRELLSRIIDNFEIIVSDADESLPEGLSPDRCSEVIAVRKGELVCRNAGDDAVVISSDTMVELDGRILGKPHSVREAHEMLSMLSGKWHNVHTGVAIHYKGRVFSGSDTTRVEFRTLDDSEIDAYIATGEPMDKAGAYGIQGLGGRFVLRYDGSFETVVGLSTSLTRRLLSEAGVL